MKSNQLNGLIYHQPVLIIFLCQEKKRTDSFMNLLLESMISFLLMLRVLSLLEMDL